MPTLYPPLIWGTFWNCSFRDRPEWNDRVKEERWSFSNLEYAFEEGGIWEYAAFREGGMLDGKKLYIFTHVEVLFPQFNDPLEQAYIPVFIVIESTFPPSDKIAFKSLRTREYEQIVDMEDSGMKWKDFNNPFCVSTNPIYRHIHPLRRSSKIPWRSDDINHCTPYFYNPFEVDTTVDIVYQTQAEAEPLRFVYDWESTEPEEPERFTNALITFNLLPAAHKDSFQELLRKRCEEGRRAYQEVLPAQERLRARGIDAVAFENMRFYKFYPDPTDDTPDITSVKTRFINKYFGDADFVF